MQAQIYDRPNYSLISHPTLEIVSIERWEDHTVVNLTLKNERLSGSFCIDSNTVLRNSIGGGEYQLLGMEGIPACPDAHQFSSVGEMISFTLIFPGIPADVKYVDLVENCNAYCVSIRYVLLDEEMNERLGEGIRLYEQGRRSAALELFQGIMDENYDGISPVFGTVWLYLISIHYELGNAKDARSAAGELRESTIIGRDDFIETARETGIIR